MSMGYKQLKHPQNKLNVKNSGRIKIENEDFLMYDVPWSNANPSMKFQ
jgi:hypothetical protein